MKKHNLILFLFVFVCCTTRLKNREKAMSDSFMKTEVFSKKTMDSLGMYSSQFTTGVPNQKFFDSLGIFHLIEEIKWTIYCINIDDTCEWKPQYVNFGKTYVSSLPLIPDDYSIQGDTVSLIFHYYVNDSIICDYNVVYNFNSIIDGVSINIKTKKQLGYLGSFGSFTVEGSRNRYVNPLQPEVIQFIKSNKNLLHPWLREEAKKRGIL